MEKTYIILLRNSYLIFCAKIPVKKRNFTNEVKLFATDGATSCAKILEWINSSYNLPEFEEVIDWV